MTADDTETGERRRLRDREQHYRAILEAAADCFFLHDAEGRILEVNGRACEQLGYTRDELLSMNIVDIEVGLTRESIATMWNEMTPGTTTTLYGSHCRKDHTCFPVEVRLGVLELHGEKQFTAFVRDITEYQRDIKAREVFASLGQKLSAISSVRDAGLVILNAADDLFSWDAAFIDLFDDQSGKLHNIATFDITDGNRSEIAPRLRTPAPGSLTEKTLKIGPQLIKRRFADATGMELPTFGDTERRSASLMFVPIRKDDQAIGLISVQSYRPGAYDDEDLRLLESLADYCSGAFDRTIVHERLREAEQRFTAAFDHAPIGLGLLKPDGDWLRVNRTLCEITGYTERDLLATGLHGITYYDDLSRSLDALLSVFAGDHNFVTFEVRLIHRNQKRVWVNFRASLVRDLGGRPLYLVAQIQDISIQRRYEQVQSSVQQLGKNLVTASTQHEVAHLVLGCADLLLGWDAAVVDLMSDDGKLMPLILFDTIDGTKCEVKPRTGEQNIGTNAFRTLTEGAKLILREPTTKPDGVLFGSNRRSASLLFVPVRREGQNVGVMTIQSYSYNAYDEQDLHVLQELADYCSTAFERAYAHGKAAEAERALRESQQRYEWVMRATSDSIYDWNIQTGKVWWSDNIRAMFGYSPGENEQNIDWWASHIHPSDHEAAYASVSAAIDAQKESWSGEYRFQRSDGSYAVVFDRGFILYENGEPQRMIGSMMDITQRKHTEEQLRHGAYHDALTGLANRLYFMEELERRTVALKEQKATTFGVLFMDLDKFKEVNDTYGHATGDKLLIEVARILKECVRPSDFSARLAGDEFTVILYDINAAADAQMVAQRLLTGMQQPISIGELKLQISASIGIAVSQSSEMTADQLLKSADEAMYAAKAGGKNRFVLHTPAAN